MPIIKVENLSKKYTLSHQQQESYTALRDVIANKVKAAGRRVLHPFLPKSSNLTQNSKEDFWALKDVSFEIEQGDRVGIIGRNGAGKSTLLKILSRITEPTGGRIGINGRVASLLEVGTGFHPELTGRENIYLNGAILGMTRVEIRQKFDEIVAFAEVEKFLDTPVKHFSSGMYVRLAFAVAAHLEPEILIVDEVLAVGDAQFQKKCLGKMQDVSTKEGRTVLFVSHNMAALQSLCTKAIQLRSGEVIGQGDVNEQIELYVHSQQNGTSINPDVPVRIGGNLTLTNFNFTPNPIECGCGQEFIIDLVAQHPDRIDSLVILVYSALGMRVAILDLRPIGFPFHMKDKRLEIRGTIETLPLVEGEYNIGLYIESSEVRDNFTDLTKITVARKLSGNNFVVYPSNVRGVVELNYEAICQH